MCNYISNFYRSHFGSSVRLELLITKKLSILKKIMTEYSSNELLNIYQQLKWTIMNQIQLNDNTIHNTSSTIQLQTLRQQIELLRTLHNLQSTIHNNINDQHNILQWIMIILKKIYNIQLVNNMNDQYYTLTMQWDILHQIHSIEKKIINNNIYERIQQIYRIWDMLQEMQTINAHICNYQQNLERTFRVYKWLGQNMELQCRTTIILYTLQDLQNKIHTLLLLGIPNSELSNIKKICEYIYENIPILYTKIENILVVTIEHMQNLYPLHITLLSSMNGQHNTRLQLNNKDLPVNNEVHRTDNEDTRTRFFNDVTKKLLTLQSK